MSWRSALRSTLPRPLLVAVDQLRRETPIRCRDAEPDAFDRLGWACRPMPMPPARLRSSVGRSSSREEYLEAGAFAADKIYAAVVQSIHSRQPLTALQAFALRPARLSRLSAVSVVAPVTTTAD